MFRNTTLHFATALIIVSGCTGTIADPNSNDFGMNEPAGAEGSGDHGTPFVPGAEHAPSGGSPSSDGPATGTTGAPKGDVASDAGASSDDAAPSADTGTSADTGSSGSSADTGSSGSSADAGSSGSSADTGSSGSSADTGSSGSSADAGKSASDAAPSVEPTKSNATLIVAEMARELAAKKSSTYTHTTFVDEATGEFDYDCSGFIGYALDRVYPSGIAAIRAATVARPLAKHFESFFASGPKSGWTRVARAIDLRPGDIVAWLTPPDVSSSNTGHVMFVRGTPTLNASRAEVIVPIEDATSSPHGAADARSAAGATGLGTGSIGLAIDSSGAPTGYYWVGGVSTTSHATSVSLGRAL